jgi:hypothetical protein
MIYIESYHFIFPGFPPHFLLRATTNKKHPQLIILMQALIDRVITCEATARGTGFSTLLQQRGIHRDRLAALIERVEHGSLIARLEHANIRPGLHSVGDVNEWIHTQN